MSVRVFLPALATVVALSACATTVQPERHSAEDDPHLWLEEVEGEAALAQVRAWNAETAAELTGTPAFEEYRARALAILSSPERIAAPDQVLGDRVTNFWTDTEHEHGLWRVSTIDQVLAGDPEWRTLIDLDALSQAEGKNWVWQGASCLAPEYLRCLVYMSDGGSDAGVIREFDMSAKRFVEDGFTAPTAKHDAAWLDRDRVLLSSDYGPGTLTESGYGRQVRLWHRGTEPQQADLLFESEPEEVGFSLYTVYTDGKRYPVIRRSFTFWDTEYRHVRADGSLVKVPLPKSAQIADLFAGKAVVLLHEEWRGHPAGSLVAYDLSALIERGRFELEPVFTPNADQAVQNVAAGADRLYVTLLDNVSGRLLALDQNWRVQDVPVPPNGVVTLQAAGGKHDAAFFTAESIADPPRLFATQSGEEPALIAELQPVFDPASVEVTQRFATSADGTRIPYFVARPAGAEGSLPTILHAYGGFRAAQLPHYLTSHPYRIGPMGLFWLQEGGSFVLANLRGGGEYGPEWHESALKENRQKVFDDLYAVAEDLKESGLSSTVAASGRSNGGLLVGAAYTQRPDLFDGIIMGVPLSDMKRYHKLLAGASWVGEYGDPDKADEWAYIREYSPYQNLRADADYPPVMIYTSTKDDRVHPGHARKMAARMESQGHDFYYYENVEGGHAGAANHAEEAYRAALMMAYAKAALKDE